MLHENKMAAKFTLKKNQLNFCLNGENVLFSFCSKRNGQKLKMKRNNERIMEKKMNTEEATDGIT